jgi:predicted RNA-binding protein associated with RNAse of E/G family
MDDVRIRYRRLPDRVQTFRQRLIHDGGDHVVTLLPAAELDRPVRAGGDVVLEPGAPVVWFTYRGDVWHDVGRFHTAAGAFTGFYANVLTPVAMDGGAWETTDLFLDVWVGATGRIEILDRDELDAAELSGDIAAGLAERARAEASTLADAARAGRFPPAHAHAWTLERVRGLLASGPDAPPPLTEP